MKASSFRVPFLGSANLAGALMVLCHALSCYVDLRAQWKESRRWCLSMRFTVVQRPDKQGPVHELVITTKGFLMSDLNMAIITNVRCFSTIRHEPCALPGVDNHEHPLYL